MRCWPSYVLVALLSSGCTSAPGESAARFDSLLVRVEALESARWSSGNLLPAGRGTSDLPISVGALLVQVDSLAPQARSTRVHLRLGNPTTVTLLELTVDVEWGVADEGTERLVRDVRLAASAESATWTESFIDLADAPPGALRVLRFSHAQFGRMTFSP